MKSSNHLCRLSLEGKQKRFFVAEKILQMLITCRSSFQKTNNHLQMFISSSESRKLGTICGVPYNIIIFSFKQEMFLPHLTPKSHIAGRPYHFLLERCPKTYSWPAGRGWQLFGESLESRRHGHARPKPSSWSWYCTHSIPGWRGIDDCNFFFSIKWNTKLRHLIISGGLSANRAKC